MMSPLFVVMESQLSTEADTNLEHVLQFQVVYFSYIYQFFSYVYLRFLLLFLFF